MFEITTSKEPFSSSGIARKTLILPDSPFSTIFSSATSIASGSLSIPTTLPKTEQGSADCEYPGPGPDIEQAWDRRRGSVTQTFGGARSPAFRRRGAAGIPDRVAIQLQAIFEPFETEASGLMVAGSERSPRINSNYQTIRIGRYGFPGR